MQHLHYDLNEDAKKAMQTACTALREGMIVIDNEIKELHGLDREALVAAVTYNDADEAILRVEDRSYRLFISTAFHPGGTEEQCIGIIAEPTWF